MLENGQEKPIIQVCWDEKAQAPFLTFPTHGFRNWAFVAAVLEMAREQAMTVHKMQTVAQAQQAMQQQKADAALAKRLDLR